MASKEKIRKHFHRMIFNFSTERLPEKETDKKILVYGTLKIVILAAGEAKAWTKGSRSPLKANPG